MRRIPGYSLRLAGMLALAIVVGSASPAAAVGPVLSMLEMRGQFASCGYQIGNPSAAIGNPYIVLRDPGADLVRDADYRIVVAIVYRDLDAATTAHARAHAQAEQRQRVRRLLNDDNGPQLLAGYGGSVWRANVALVESSRRTLNSIYSYDIQTDEARLARPELLELGFTSSVGQYAVDRDVVACLEDASLTARAIDGDGIGGGSAAVNNQPLERINSPIPSGHPW